MHDKPSPSLPALADTRLPATYESAQRALAECSRVDECKEWADKASALAAYARMARNDELRLMALRIQERATRRMGELLKQIPSAQGANLTAAGRGGAVPISRESVARDAGLSERQRKTALRVANIPRGEFEAAIESDSPPTLTELAMRGTAPMPPAGARDVPRADPEIATAARALLREFAAFCGAHDPARVALSMSDPDICRGHVESIDRWLDRFVTNLPAEQSHAA